MRELNPRIAELRQHLMTEKTFSVTFNKFFDITESDSVFMSSGHHSSNAEMLTLVKTSLGLYFKKKIYDIRPQQMQFIENPNENLFHGSGFLFGYIFSFFYFRDLDKGMIGLCKMGTSETTIMRLTIEHTRKVDTSNLNPN